MCTCWEDAVDGRGEKGPETRGRSRRMAPRPYRPAMERRAPFAAALAASLALSGCSRGGGEPRELRLAFPASATSLDPHMHDEEATYSTLAHFYDRLVTFSPELEVTPLLALSWENPSDTVWRFRLKTGVKFHDGRDFTADDAAATLTRALTLPGSKVAFYLQPVESARALAPDLLEVKTRYPTAVLLNKLAFIDVVPRDAGSAPITRPVGTGPYRFVSGAPGQPVVGESFDAYHGARPAFRRVTILPFPDERARAAAVPEGKADLAGRLAEEHWDWAGRQANVRLLKREGVGVTMLGFSVRPGSPFADVRVRRAVALSVDRGRLAAPDSRPALAVPMAQVVPPGVFGHGREVSPEAPDLAGARSLLAAAGFGQGLSTTLLVPESSRPLAEAISGQVAAAGIRLTLDVRPWPEFYELWSEASFTSCLFAWTAATGDVSDVLDALLHRRGDGYGGSNHLGYANPELDLLIEQSDRTLDPYQRLSLVAQALRIVRDDVPVVPLVVRSHLYAVRPGLDWTPRRDRRIRAVDVKPAEGA